jgi:hypothetical protein
MTSSDILSGRRIAQGISCYELRIPREGLRMSGLDLLSGMMRLTSGHV